MSSDVPVFTTSGGVRVGRRLSAGSLHHLMFPRHFRLMWFPDSGRFPLTANGPHFQRSLPIRPGNDRCGHTSSPLHRNNQHAVCAACGHKAPQLGPGSLSKTISTFPAAVQKHRGLLNREEWARRSRDVLVLTWLLVVFSSE